MLSVLSHVFSFFSLVILTLLIVIPGIASIADSSEKGIVIQPIEIPETLQEKGLTKEGVAELLRERMLRLVRTADAGWAPAIIAAGKPIEIPIGGVSVPSDTILDFARPLLAPHDARLYGQIYSAQEDPPRYRFYLVVKGQEAAFLVQEGRSIDEVVDKMALGTLKHLAPFTAASYLNTESNKNAAEALETLFRLLREPDPLPKGKKGPPRIERHWIYLTWGYILANNGRFDDAIEKYKRADREFASVNGRAGWPVAQEAWALTFRAKAEGLPEESPEWWKNQDEAYLLFRRAVDANPDYASLRYNLGLLELNYMVRPCAAATQFKHVTNIDPRYGLAWEAWGTAILKELTRRRTEGKWDTACFDADSEALHAQAEERFAKSIGLNPGSSSPWFQWGILLEQRKDYEGAVEKLQQAVKLNKTDKYIQTRLAQAVRSRDLARKAVKQARSPS